SSTMAGTGIDVDPAGNIYLTGVAPDVFAVGRALVDQFDSQLQISDTLLIADNGSGEEAGLGIAYSTATDTVFVTGTTTSTNLSTDGSVLNGQQDGFLANVGSFGF